MPRVDQTTGDGLAVGIHDRIANYDANTTNVDDAFIGLIGLLGSGFQTFHNGVELGVRNVLVNHPCFVPLNIVLAVIGRI